MRWGVYCLIFLILACSSYATIVDSEVLSDLQEDNKARVIVTYDQPGPFLYNHGVIDAPEINTFVGELSGKDIASLSNDPRIKTIQSDWKLSISRDDGWDIINADILNNLTMNGTNLTGAGYAICVLDTGVAYNHSEFGSCNTSEFENGTCDMFPYGFDYVNNDEDPWDDEGHGTHVTGIINRVAPDVKIIPLKVCDAAGDCYISDMITATSWCNAFKDVYNISVITMSIGDEGEWSDDDCFPSDALSQQIALAKDNGILITAASGNDGYSGGINYPACTGGAVSVGATTDADTIAYFTDTYSTLDLLAPGYHINSTYNDGSYVTKSGTSMATPFAAASGVLLLQYHELNDNITLTPTELEYNLKSGGVTVESWPRIDLNASLSSGYECFLAEDCGEIGWIGSGVCVNDTVFQNYSNSSCNTGYCNSSVELLDKEVCTNGCESGSCLAVQEETSSSGGGSSGGSFSENIGSVEIITNNDWAQGQEAQITIYVYDRMGELYDPDKVQLILIMNSTHDEMQLNIPERTSQGTYQLVITPEMTSGEYILQANAIDMYQTKTAEKSVNIVQLSRVLTTLQLNSGIQDAEAPGFLAKVMNWLKKFSWADKWP